MEKIDESRQIEIEKLFKEKSREVTVKNHLKHNIRTSYYTLEHDIIIGKFNVIYKSHVIIHPGETQLLIARLNDETRMTITLHGYQPASANFILEMMPKCITIKKLTEEKKKIIIESLAGPIYSALKNTSETKKALRSSTEK